MDDELPHWDATPTDIPGAIREIKAAIRARIEASGRTIAEVVAAMARRVDDRVAEIDEDRRRGDDVWPVVEYGDIEAGTVPASLLDKLRRRGCLVVRGNFEREQALEWDRDIVDYVDANRFFEQYRGPGDGFFDSVDSKPEIYPIYWSRAQLQARQSDRMARVRAFLNAQWRHESGGTQWFDPSRDLLYPDRIRRRPPGTTSRGLKPHLDTGTLDLWMMDTYQRVFRHVFDGTIEQYDPWDASHRTTGGQFAGSTMCSAFRTFQGWTALSDMDHDQGVLHAIPIPEAMGYLLLRPLLDDVDDDDLCGVRVGRAFPVTRRWHPDLLDALSGIPDVRAGDSVWWHCDTVHCVEPVHDQRGWGNVMYIPAAPWCARNDRYATTLRDAFATGSSPADFPAEHYERDWPDRCRTDELSATGRRGLGLA